MNAHEAKALAESSPGALANALQHAYDRIGAQAAAGYFEAIVSQTPLQEQVRAKLIEQKYNVRYLGDDLLVRW